MKWDEAEWEEEEWAKAPLKQCEADKVTQKAIISTYCC